MVRWQQHLPFRCDRVVSAMTTIARDDDQGSLFVGLYVCVCVSVKLRIAAQSDPVLLLIVILCYSRMRVCFVYL